MGKTANKFEFPYESDWRKAGHGYFVSPEGDVYSAFSGKLLAPGIGTNGRPLVSFKRAPDEKQKTVYIHVLVCSTFHGPRPEGREVSHIDGNVLNNRASNLVWETSKENHARKVQHGTKDIGFANSRAVLTPEKVRRIFSLRQAKATHNEIAEAIGVSRTTISRVLNRKRYQNE